MADMTPGLTPSETAEGKRFGVSRRTVLKGGVAAAGVVWVAPVIESMTTPAFAGSAQKQGVSICGGECYSSSPPSGGPEQL